MASNEMAPAPNCIPTWGKQARVGGGVGVLQESSNEDLLQIGRWQNKAQIGTALKSHSQ